MLFRALVSRSMVVSLEKKAINSKYICMCISLRINKFAKEIDWIWKLYLEKEGKIVREKKYGVWVFV